MRLRPLVVGSTEELREELERIEVDARCVDIFTDKQDSFLVKISALSTPAANIFKQTALSLGADVAVHRQVITGKIECSDVIFMGTRRQLRRTALALSGQPFGLGSLEGDVSRLLTNLNGKCLDLDLPGGKLTFTHPVIMGALNVTPDSFSDGGRFLDPRAARDRIDEMLAEGADIIDVGAESTRPGSDSVPVTQQLDRLEKVIVHLQDKKCMWSIDTTQSDVARHALQAGASILNDTSGGLDPSLWLLAKEHRAAYVLMHIKGTPRTMQRSPSYRDFPAELFGFFTSRLEEISSAGLPRTSLIIDPGIGFGKRLPDNTAAIRRLGELRAFGLPILVGASRKSFLGKILGTEACDRLEGSLAAAVLSAWNGASILRVHDVAQTRQALDTAAAIRSVNRTGEETW